MSQKTVVCPYCGNMITIASNQQQSGRKVLLKIYEHERLSTVTRPSFDLHCNLCDMKYEYIDVRDFSWIKRHIELSKAVLVKFKTILPGQEWGNLEFIFENIAGITKPRNGYLHICFNLEGERVFLECLRKGHILTAIGLYRV